MNAAKNQYAPFNDVVVIGGALSGAATATLLLRQNSSLRVCGEIGATKPTCRRGDGRSQRLLHGESVGLNAIPQMSRVS
jgi:hypothetical protein